MKSIREFLKLFQEGNLEVEKYFNDYETWFQILSSRNLMGELDPINDSDSAKWQNEWLLWAYEYNRPLFYKVVDSLLGDIVIEDGKIFWFGDVADLSNLFCNNRNDISRDTIQTILIGEDFWEPYWETTDNVYRDVIEELDEKNLQFLKEYILKQLSSQKLSPETEEMELIASEQGHDDYWEINSENVARIIDDEESMISLLGDELSDLKSELYSIHSSAYNTAGVDEIYNSVWEELQEYFDGKPEWVSVPHPYKKETTIQKVKIPVASHFDDIILNFLNDNKKYSDGTLEYHGSFVQIVSEYLDCLSIRFRDYPDFRLVDKYINEFFPDYI